MQVKICDDNNILDMGYLDPMLVNEGKVTLRPQHTEDYIVTFLEEFQRKDYIFIPYNCRYICNYESVVYHVQMTFPLYL